MCEDPQVQVRSLALKQLRRNSSGAFVVPPPDDRAIPSTELALAQACDDAADNAIISASFLKHVRSCIFDS